MEILRAALCAAVALTSLAAPARAADYSAPQEGDWIAKDFKFHTGEVMPELKLHYTTIGAPGGQLVLHGSGGSAQGMLTPAFAGELFGPGQPLDAAKYFVIIPDSVGHGKSAKPSDAMKTAFPKYNYDDMVDAQYRLVTEGLGIKHLNPPETGVTEAAVKRIKNGKIYLIPASTETRGHLTTGNAKFYAQSLRDLLQSAPQRTM
jgi:homoserine O-acetyltransferase